MEVVSFTYQKPGDDIPTLRFVGKVKSYNSTIEGYDLTDNQYKTFLKDRMTTTPTNICTISDGIHNKVINLEELYRCLGYGVSEQTVVESLNTPASQLAELLAKKTNKNVMSIGNNHFIVQPKEFRLNVPINSGYICIIVKPGKLEFSDSNGVRMDINAFTQLVLS